MACVSCDYRGYIETFIHTAADARPMIAQCGKCKDVAAYSKRIQSLLGIKSQSEPYSKPIRPLRGGEPCPVVPFKRG